MTREATPLDVIEGRARWCVVCGERDEVLASLGDAVVDVTITDPPYNERTHKGGGIKSLVGGEVKRIALGFDAVTDFDFVPRMVAVTRRWCLAFCALEDLGVRRVRASGRDATVCAPAVLRATRAIGEARAEIARACREVAALETVAPLTGGRA